MNIKKIFMLLCLFLITSFIAKGQAIPADSLYLGQKPPGAIPQIFKLQITDKFFAAERIAISNDNKNIYYQELDGYTEMDGKPHSMRLKQYNFSNGKWNGPTVLFEEKFAPCLSIKGDTMYMQKGIYKTFYSVKQKDGWSTPVQFLKNIKVPHYLQRTQKGNFYITSNPANSVGGLDRSRLFINGADTTISSLGPVLNTAGHDFDFFIARDESYIIIATPNGLCISFPAKDGWTTPKNLGREINFGLNSWGPFVTADNKYLFYTAGTKPDYSDTSIYWVYIEELIKKLKETP